MKKPNFFFYAYIVDIFCPKFHYPNLGWSRVLPALPIHIYHAELWNTNYVTKFYDICENFLGWVYFLIFKKEAPAFSPKSKNIIATMGDWYVSESFSYIRVFGISTSHMIPKVVTNRLVLE